MNSSATPAAARSSNTSRRSTRTNASRWATSRERFASEEHDIPPATVSAEQRKTVYVSLLQSHLPKLDAAGVVAWNDRSGAVAPGGCVADLATLVEGIDRACDPETA